MSRTSQEQNNVNEVLTLRFYKLQCVQNMRILTFTSTALFASASLEIVKYQGTRDSRWLNFALTLPFVEFRCRTQSSRISDKSSPWRHNHKNKRYENQPGLKTHSHGYYKWHIKFKHVLQLTNSMEQRSPCMADSHSTAQWIPAFYDSIRFIIVFITACLSRAT